MSHIIIISVLTAIRSISPPSPVLTIATLDFISFISSATCFLSEAAFSSKDATVSSSFWRFHFGSIKSYKMSRLK